MFWERGYQPCGAAGGRPLKPDALCPGWRPLVSYGQPPYRMPHVILRLLPLSSDKRGYFMISLGLWLIAVRSGPRSPARPPDYRYLERNCAEPQRRIAPSRSAQESAVVLDSWSSSNLTTTSAVILPSRSCGHLGGQAWL